MDRVCSSSSPLEGKLAQLLERRRRESKLRELKASRPGSVDLSSNDFLSLSTSTQLRSGYLKELENTQTQLGSTGSRLLDGNSVYAENLEKEIATFHGGPTALLTNSGFDANVSLFSCLPQPGDIIVYDELIHASVHDGMRQSRTSRCLPFAHNSVKDLSRVLIESQDLEPNLKSGMSNIFIAVETVYSMEGDLAPLTEMVHVAETLFPHKNAHIIVDEAHATGIYGPQGRGRVSELGLENRIFARLHTFGKALACNGAAILCSPVTRLYLINYARPLIYTTFMSFPSLAAIKNAYEFMKSGQTVAMSERLFRLIQRLHNLLLELQSNLKKSRFDLSLLNTSKACPESPIFALMTKYPRSLAKHCQDAGFVVRAVVPPTVPTGTERVRVCLHAGNTENEIVEFVQQVRQWAEARMLEEQSSSFSPPKTQSQIAVAAKL